MASIIKSDNGVSSGITGIVQSADSSGQLVLQTTTSSGTATTAVTIDNTQKVTFANSIGFGSNAGITFNNSSALTNSTLNDYETGTWTPTLGGTSTMTGSKGIYTKVGNLVYVAFDFTVNSIGSANGWTISGLPFSSVSPSSGLGYVGSFSYGYYSNLAISVTSLSGYMPNNSTGFILTATTSASSTINQNSGPNAILQGSSRLIGGLIYQATF